MLENIVFEPIKVGVMTIGQMYNDFDMGERCQVIEHRRKAVQPLERLNKKNVEYRYMTMCATIAFYLCRARQPESVAVA